MHRADSGQSHAGPKGPKLKTHERGSVGHAPEEIELSLHCLVQSRQSCEEIPSPRVGPLWRIAQSAEGGWRSRLRFRSDRLLDGPPPVACSGQRPADAKMPQDCTGAVLSNLHPPSRDNRAREERNQRGVQRCVLARGPCPVAGSCTNYREEISRASSIETYHAPCHTSPTFSVISRTSSASLDFASFLGLSSTEATYAAMLYFVQKRASSGEVVNRTWATLPIRSISPLRKALGEVVYFLTLALAQAAFSLFSYPRFFTVRAVFHRKYRCQGTSSVLVDGIIKEANTEATLKWALQAKRQGDQLQDLLRHRRQHIVALSLETYDGNDIDLWVLLEADE